MPDTPRRRMGLTEEQRAQQDAELASGITWAHTAAVREARTRFALIGDLIREGRIDDLAPEARSWYVHRAAALEVAVANTSGVVGDQLGEARAALL